MDKFTETTTTGYGTNLGNSIKGMGTGFMLVLASIALLWWNEGESVKTASALSEMESNTITLTDTKYNAANDGKPVLIQGELKPKNQLVDGIFGVSSDGLLLRRVVEMYQWEETTHTETHDKLGGGTETTTTYDYAKKWVGSPVDSSKFKHPSGHENPQMTYQTQDFGTDATLGEYSASVEILSSITADTPISLKGEKKYLGGFKNYDTYLYSGYNVNSPKIGDMKVTYAYAPVGLYTIVAKSQSKQLTHYATSNGKQFAFVKKGAMDAQQLFKAEQDANATMTWILRAIGLVLMYIGFTMLMGILPTLAKVLPFLGTLVGGVTGIIAGVLTLVLGSLVIAIAWFASRPMLAIGLIVGGLVLAFVLSTLAKNKAQTTPPTE